MAELKPHRLGWYLREVGSFHGVTTVAELKQPGRCVFQQSHSPFHGVTTVAELKQAVTAKLAVRFVSFHGVTTVAELKRSLHLGDGGRDHLSTASQPWPN